MPDQKPSSNTSKNNRGQWTDTYSPPAELEGQNGKVAIHHVGRQATAALQRQPSPPVKLPTEAEINVARAALTKFFAVYFKDPHNQSVLGSSRNVFHLQYSETGIPLVPKSNNPADWYEVRALLRSFGLLSRVSQRRVDMSLSGQENASAKAAGQFLKQLPSVEVMDVIQRLASAVQF